MNIESEDSYKDIIRRLIEYYPLIENALQEGDMCDEVEIFLLQIWTTVTPPWKI